MDRFDRIVSTVLSLFAVVGALTWLFRFGFTLENVVAWTLGTAFCILVLWQKAIWKGGRSA